MHTRIINISAILLIVVGVGGYVLSNQASPTALIPTVLGALMLAAEAFGRRRSGLLANLWIPLISLLGLTGTLKGIPVLFASLLSEGPGPSLPTVGRSLTAVLCLIALAVAVHRWRTTDRTAE